MRQFFLTNDDGIDAPGLSALREAAQALGEITTVAPHEHLSGCSHRVTTDRKIRIQKRNPKSFAVEGTPADCVRVGLHGLVPEVDWVLSGINSGGNLGTDVFLSGTVAAVREAVLFGKPGIAFSHYRRKGQDFDWPRATRWVTAILNQLLAQPWKPGTFWNVNLPNLQPEEPDPEIIFCPLDRQPLPVEFIRENDTYLYCGNYHGRLRDPGSDVDVCFAGQIAVTVLNLHP